MPQTALVRMARSAQCPSPRSRPGKSRSRAYRREDSGGRRGGRRQRCSESGADHGAKACPGQNRGARKSSPEQSVESGAIDVRTDRSAATRSFPASLPWSRAPSPERAPVQKLADKVAVGWIPVVLIFSGRRIPRRAMSRKVVTLLIFTSPAELGLATPLVMIAVIARAARSGILIKGGLYLEAAGEGRRGGL